MVSKLPYRFTLIYSLFVILFHVVDILRAIRVTAPMSNLVKLRHFEFAFGPVPTGICAHRNLSGRGMRTEDSVFQEEYLVDGRPLCAYLNFCDQL